MVELDPRYCDVIVKRWQKGTGRQATLEANGRAFGAEAPARANEAAAGPHESAVAATGAELAA